MPSMKLNSTYEELKAYVQAQMRAMDCAIKECQSGSQISAALEEIAACTKLVFFAQDAFHIEVADKGWAEAKRDTAEIESDRREKLTS